LWGSFKVVVYLDLILQVEVGEGPGEVAMKRKSMGGESERNSPVGYRSMRFHELGCLYLNDYLIRTTRLDFWNTTTGYEIASSDSLQENLLNLLSGIPQQVSLHLSKYFL
jgi:hypothetical protein